MSIGGAKDLDTQKEKEGTAALGSCEILYFGWIVVARIPSFLPIKIDFVKGCSVHFISCHYLLF